MDEFIIDPHEFSKRYHKHNEEVWGMYRKKQIRKHELRIERFRRLLNDYDMKDEGFIQEISSYYIEHSPRKPILVKDAKEILDYLSPNYSLYIISNGFYEAQCQKLISSNIADYFKKVFTSEKIGDSKPSRYFFEYTIKTCNAKKTDSLVIGDDLDNDIIGAMKFGLDQIWLNPQETVGQLEPTYTIKGLNEIKNILQ